MVYVTGDIHGDVYDLKKRCTKIGCNAGDICIILGDAGFNFYLNQKAHNLKSFANSLGVIFFCVHGNHEARPDKIKSYKIKEFNGGKVFFEETYPNLLFAIDGEIYDFDGKKAIVIGGAYSIDKYYRVWRYYLNNYNSISADKYLSLIKLAEGQDVLSSPKVDLDNFILKAPYGLFSWFDDEQPSDIIKTNVINSLNNINWDIDIVLSHTCPIEYEPTDVFLPGINQKMVDKTTENWLSEINSKLNYNKWYAGHYHLNRKVNDKFEFLFRDIKPLF